jgi:hypothetical protein
VARPRLICHEGTLYESPELPPGADGRARHYDLPGWEREEKFGSWVACALLVCLRGGEVILIRWMAARRGLARAGCGLYRAGKVIS